MIRTTPPRLRCALALVAIASSHPGIAQSAASMTDATPTSRTSGVDTYAYQSDRIYPIRTGLGITTQLELSPSETILDYSSGFSTGWDIERRGHVFYVKPKNVDVDTNLMIRTATHSYIFELKVVATDWRTLDQARREGVQYKVSFTYPPDTRFQPETKPAHGKRAEDASRPTETAELDTGLVKGRDYHFDYDYAKRRRTAPWLVPKHVYDDGRFTYIHMPDLKRFPTGNFPTIYMREKGHGDDEIVNTTIEGNTIVVHGTYAYLVIRHDKNVVGLRRNAKK